MFLSTNAEQRKMKVNLKKKSSRKTLPNLLQKASINTYSKGKLVKATRFSKIVYFFDNSIFLL